MIQIREDCSSLKTNSLGRQFLHQAASLYKHFVVRKIQCLNGISSSAAEVMFVLNKHEKYSMNREEKYIFPKENQANNPP